jgi:ZIP family zinc transporter
MGDFWTIVAISGAAAVASPAGGALALWHRPSTLIMSLAIGFAAGVLIATIGFEMLPQALELAGLAIAVAGFATGFGSVYLLDLFINRWRVAGEKAEQRDWVRSHHKRYSPHGDEVTVLAGGTSAEELIEGISIGVGAAIQPGLGLMIGLAIVIDNISEALSIGELSIDQGSEARPWRRVLGWTGLIGVSLLSSALAGYFLLRSLPESVLGFLFAAGGGGMFYLTVTDLVPDAEERQYQQSGALAIGAGFITIFVLGQFM